MIPKYHALNLPTVRHLGELSMPSAKAKRNVVICCVPQHSIYTLRRVIAELVTSRFKQMSSYPEDIAYHD
jgi:hypothetical protein